MNIKNTISISEARKRIFELLESVQKPGVRYTLTEKGKAKGVLMSAEELDSLMETMEIMSDPNIAKKIALAEKEISAGKYVTWDEFKNGIRSYPKAGVVVDKGKKKYRAKKR